MDGKSLGFGQLVDFSLVVQTQIQEELFSNYKFLKMKKPDPSRGSKMMLKNHNLGRYLKWIGKQTDENLLS